MLRRTGGLIPPSLSRLHLPALFLALACLLALPGSALAANNCTATTYLGFATDIAHGHAFTKHSAEFVNGAVIDGLAFPDPTIANADQFTTFLNGILDAPSDNKPLSNDRHAYWDDATGTVIITNLKPADCGTAFRPNAGKAYYDNLT